MIKKIPIFKPVFFRFIYNQQIYYAFKSKLVPLDNSSKSITGPSKTVSGVS